MPPSTLPNRDGALQLLANASNKGRLGLFVGTGFSIAATAGDAPSFEDLLRRVAAKLKLDEKWEEKRFRHKSFPQLASQLVQDLAELKNIKPEEALSRFREQIAVACNLTPNEKLQPDFERALASCRPSWIVTTNYDLILEALIEEAQPVLPDHVLFPNKDRVPIYHLHGHRHHPDSIRITEEDYVGLIAPLDYQRLKLPLLFLESTTLLLGYSLGDINVRAAMEWSKSFRGENGLTLARTQGCVVQALFTKKPDQRTKWGPDGQIIVETDHICALLQEIGDVAQRVQSTQKAVLDSISAFLTNNKNALAIVENGPERKAFLKIVETAVGRVSAKEVVLFLKAATEPVWEKARQPGAFEYYDEYLSVLLDVLKRLEYQEANPNLMRFLAVALNRVGHYFDERPTMGNAHKASKRWVKEAPDLPPELIGELRVFAKSHGLIGLTSMLNCSSLKTPKKT